MREIKRFEICDLKKIRLVAIHFLIKGKLKSLKLN